MAKKDIKKTLKEATVETLKLMGISSNVDVEEDEKNELYKVKIDNEKERGLLIGKKGETINSLQLVLGMMLKNRLGEWKRVEVNIGQWREKQEDYLRSLAIKTAQRAIETGEPQSLYNLNPVQRRIVHMEVAEIDSVESESQGEGNERYLVIKPK